MKIYIPDYDNNIVKTVVFDCVANLDALYRELEENFEEFYLDFEDCYEALKKNEEFKK